MASIILTTLHLKHTSSKTYMSWSHISMHQLQFICIYVETLSIYHLFRIRPNVKSGYGLPFCFQVMVPEHQKLTSSNWSNWTNVSDLKKFPECVLKKLHLQKWDGHT